MDASERPSPTDVVSKTKRTLAVVVLVLLVAGLVWLVLRNLDKRDPGGMGGTMGLTAPGVTRFG